jgi:hypothetical protein
MKSAHAIAGLKFEKFENNKNQFFNSVKEKALSERIS